LGRSSSLPLPETQRRAAALGAAAAAAEAVQAAGGVDDDDDDDDDAAGGAGAFGLSRAMTTGGGAVLQQPQWKLDMFSNLEARVAEGTAQLTDGALGKILGNHDAARSLRTTSSAVEQEQEKVLSPPEVMAQVLS